MSQKSKPSNKKEQIYKDAIRVLRLKIDDNETLISECKEKKKSDKNNGEFYKTQVKNAEQRNKNLLLAIERLKQEPEVKQSRLF